MLSEIREKIKISHCCCCIDLKTGIYIYGILGLVFHISLIVIVPGIPASSSPYPNEFFPNCTAIYEKTGNPRIDENKKMSLDILGFFSNSGNYLLKL